MAAMPNVRDNTAQNRFELDADGATAFVNYRIDGGTITLLHTETPVALRWRGIATRLVEGVLEDIRARGLKMVPRCAFVRAFLAKHPEFHDLVS
jgi:predicted GNAT family acetyltransferase